MDPPPATIQGRLLLNTAHPGRYAQVILQEQQSKHCIVCEPHCDYVHLLGDQVAIEGSVERDESGGIALIHMNAITLVSPGP